ncbi:MAG: FapA family protein [Paenisporosarcina sp.]
MLLEENKFITLNEVQGKVMVTIHKPGYPLKDFEKTLQRNPRIKIPNFIELKKALVSENIEDLEIGLFLPSIELEYTNDLMSAHIIIHETIEYSPEFETNINKRVNLLLRENGVVHGIQKINIKDLKTSKPYTIAKGTPPEKGADAKITYLERPERKPIIDEEGKADYFDMNFILEIAKDDWLGEKLEAREGTLGMNIKGESIPAIKGKDHSLKYDSKSVYEIEEQGKSILRAKISGVLDVQDGKIMIHKHLPIKGDVGVETGNLKFDGSISITGTVMSGFSVVASGDISIESSDGVFNAKHIQSVHGDIYIRGGIFGKGESLVEAGGSIYVKHSNESILSANKDIHIGYYSLGSTIRANNVFVNELKGKIIGGRTEAINVITTAFSGNHLERRTDLIVLGINRQALQNEVKIKAVELRDIQEDIYSFEKKVIQLQLMLGEMSAQQMAVYEDSKQLLEEKQKLSSQLDREIQQILVTLRTPDECEIRVSKEAHAGTNIQIGQKTKLFNHQTSGVFKIENGELNV